MKKKTKTAAASFEVFGLNVRKLRDSIAEAVSKMAAKAKKAVVKAYRNVKAFLANQEQVKFGLMLCPLKIEREGFATFSETTVYVFGWRVFFLFDSPTETSNKSGEGA